MVKKKPPTQNIFLQISHGVRREVPPSRTRTWQIPTGAQIKNSAKNQHTRVNKSTVPSSTVPQANDLVVEVLTLIKKKNKYFNSTTLL